MIILEFNHNWSKFYLLFFIAMLKAIQRILCDCCDWVRSPHPSPLNLHLSKSWSFFLSLLKYSSPPSSSNFILTEEIMTLSLKYLILENLSELKHIFMGTEHNLSFRHLRTLEITECRELQFVFSASKCRSLPELWMLKISNCEVEDIKLRRISSHHRRG